MSLFEVSAQRVERMDYLGRLYLTGKNKDDLNTVQATAALLDASLVQLESTIWDSSQQSQAHSARDCAAELTRQVNVLVQQDTEAGKMSLTRKALECRNIISRMQVEESALLKQRTNAADRTIYRNRSAGLAILLLSLAVVLILFGFLLRDAGQRIKIEEQLFETNFRLNNTVQTLQERVDENKVRAAMRRELQICATPTEAHNIVVRYLRQVVPAAKIALLTVNPSQQILEIAATSDDQTEIMDGVPLNACCAMRGARTRHRQPGVSEIDCTHFRSAPPQNYICLPLAAQGEALGILYVGCPDAGTCTRLDAHLEFLQGLTEMSSTWIAGLNLRARLEEESIHDGLTNLYNRRFMETALDRELRLAARRRGELSLLMLDIDHFKRFNDTFGHAAGDQVLRDVAETLRESVRTEDIVCRYGGEELLVILPGMGTEASFERAEDIRKRVSAMIPHFEGGSTQKVTISIGISTYPHTGQISEELVHAADRALYNAKQSGRNRVVVAESAIPA